MSDVYEPWQPQVGQRVMVNISPECDFCNPWEHGRSGVVVATDHGGFGLESYRLIAHRFTVRLDQPDERDAGEPYYAAAELEPLAALSQQDKGVGR